ncbi:MAG: glycosyltransferase family 4 protein [Hyphomonas sp.]
MTGLVLVWIVLPLLVSFGVCSLMIRLGPQDAPDGARKMQAAPVPSAGGVGILAGLAAAMLVGLTLLPQVPGAGLGAIAMTGLTGPLVFVLIAGALGYADDCHNLAAKPKLAVLAVGAVLAAILGPQISRIWLPGAAGSGFEVWPVLAVAGVALWLFVMANAVNFMDGANGIALGSAAIMLMALALLALPGALNSPREGGVVVVLILAAAVAAVAGFLAWNLAGKLYAGDTGSLAIGAVLAGAGAVVAQTYSVWVPAALALPFLIDVLLTLAWRAKRGRPLMQAHRDHAYQLLLRAGWRHGQVAGVWWAMTALCAGAVLLAPASGIFGLFGFSWTPSLSFMVFAGLLAFGTGLWTWQRMTLGSRLEAEGL